VGSDGQSQAVSAKQIWPPNIKKINAVKNIRKRKVILFAIHRPLFIFIKGCKLTARDQKRFLNRSIMRFILREGMTINLTVRSWSN